MPPSPLVVFGHNSFIGKHLIEAATAARIPVQGFGHAADPAHAIRAGDLVVNCAMAPELRTGPYIEALDMDLRLARAAAACGAHFTMLSTRRVYPQASRWDAVESAEANGDETAYGRNKALSERAVTEATRGGATLLRLSNIIGFEYVPGGKRASFMGKLLQNLRIDQSIHFEMHPGTRRDFLPVTACAGAILAASQQRLSGTLNLGCGFPVRCGDIAEWTRIGYGAGQIIVDKAVIHDEFFLNMGKWRSHFPPPTTPAELQSFCIEIGRGLRNA